MQDFYDAIKHLAGGEVYAVVAPQTAQYPTLVYTPVDQTHVVAIDGPGALKVCDQLQDQVLAALMADIHTIADVRMSLTDFDQDAQVYRVSVDFTYYR